MYGQQTSDGHFLYASHSVHEDVKVENYYAVIDAYRQFFGKEHCHAWVSNRSSHPNPVRLRSIMRR